MFLVLYERRWNNKFLYGWEILSYVKADDKGYGIVFNDKGGEIMDV